MIAGMAIALLIFGVVFAACVWLAVRIVNRRERWAKWTLATVVALPVLYVAGFVPACWFIQNSQPPVEMKLMVAYLYAPLVFVADRSPGSIVHRYVYFWLD